MATTAPHAGFDKAGFRSALDERDARTQLCYFAECAQVCIVTRGQPASTGRTLSGRGEVRTWLAELCSTYQGISTVDLVCEDGMLLVIAECRRPDGTLDVYAATGHQMDGLIVEQFVVLLEARPR